MMKKIMNDNLKEKTLKYILYKMRTEKEVRKFLREKHGAEQEEVEDIIQYLYSYNYLDDEKYAEMFVRDKLRFSPVGRIKMSYELSNRGISSDVISNIVEEYLYLEKEVEIAKYLLEKKGKLADSTVKKQRYLYSRGFSNSAIARAVKLDENNYE